VDPLALGSLRRHLHQPIPNAMTNVSFTACKNILRFSNPVSASKRARSAICQTIRDLTMADCRAIIHSGDTPSAFLGGAQPVPIIVRNDAKGFPKNDRQQSGDCKLRSRARRICRRICSDPVSGRPACNSDCC
jgi:hypothetical protein